MKFHRRRRRRQCFYFTQIRWASSCLRVCVYKFIRVRVCVCVIFRLKSACIITDTEEGKRVTLYPGVTILGCCGEAFESANWQKTRVTGPQNDHCCLTWIRFLNLYSIVEPDRTILFVLITMENNTNILLNVLILGRKIISRILITF